jgi:tRNA(Ile)-lysidine synthase
VSLDADRLRRRLVRLEAAAAEPSRYVIAFSGGLDSTVLLHALAGGAARHGVPILAVYIDHGLQSESAEWGRRCESIAAEIGVGFQRHRVQVDAQAPKGLEAAAREARYGALREVVEPGDWLLSAHHRDDQAETLLLNLVRGSGPAGLAGIGELQRFAAGWLVRPLLDVSKLELLAYARDAGLEWITDPSNEDLSFDRNYLRHEVLPALEQRWPGVTARLRRSAALSGQAALLLEELASIDALQLGERPDCLGVAALRQLSPARQRNVLRFALSRLGLPTPAAKHVDRIVTEVLTAREDAQPLVAWPGAEVRRYRGNLYLLSAGESPVPAQEVVPVTGNSLLLPAGLGTLVFDRSGEEGLSEAVMGQELELRFRAGGEEIKLPDQKHTKKLKKLLQEEAVVPWMRDRLPLLYANGQLVAVADLWIAASALARPGTAIEWRDRPAIH